MSTSRSGRPGRSNSALPRSVPIVSVTFVALSLSLGLVPAAAAGERGREVEVKELTVTRIHEALRTGRTTCRQIVAGSLRRIRAYDDRGPRLQAVITVNLRALAQARRARRGPLHCVPILVKDNYDTQDLPTTGSAAALRESQPPDDATTVRRLRRAGAVVVGKANLTELALTGTTFGSFGGQTRNPYDLTRTPGGSSGGTGAGVAAGFAVAGTGSDTVNSIRSPSSPCRCRCRRPQSRRQRRPPSLRSTRQGCA